MTDLSFRIRHFRSVFRGAWWYGIPVPPWRHCLWGVGNG